MLCTPHLLYISRSRSQPKENVARSKGSSIAPRKRALMPHLELAFGEKCSSDEFRSGAPLARKRVRTPSQSSRNVSSDKSLGSSAHDTGRTSGSLDQGRESSRRAGASPMSIRPDGSRSCKGPQFCNILRQRMEHRRTATTLACSQRRISSANTSRSLGQASLKGGASPSSTGSRPPDGPWCVSTSSKGLCSKSLRQRKAHMPAATTSVMVSDACSPKVIPLQTISRYSSRPSSGPSAQVSRTIAQRKLAQQLEAGAPMSRASLIIQSVTMHRRGSDFDSELDEDSLDQENRRTFLVEASAPRSCGAGIANVGVECSANRGSMRGSAFQPSETRLSYSDRCRQSSVRRPRNHSVIFKAAAAYGKHVASQADTTQHLTPQSDDARQSAPGPCLSDSSIASEGSSSLRRDMSSLRSPVCSGEDRRSGARSRSVLSDDRSIESSTKKLRRAGLCVSTMGRETFLEDPERVMAEPSTGKMECGAPAGDSSSSDEDNSAHARPKCHLRSARRHSNFCQICVG